MATPVAEDLDGRIEAVRRFNRFYTQRIGVLHAGYQDSPFSLTEARVLYEMWKRDGATATDIGRDLDLDAGYLSRILRRFHKQGLVRRETSPADARQSLLSLTERGRKAFKPLEARTRRQVGAILEELTAERQSDLVSALRVAETLLTEKQTPRPAIVLRQPKPGDFGWIVQRHGVLYAEEYGWANEFEGVCAQIVADFVHKLDPGHERCWIAELDGQRVGCVMLVKDKPEVARLRLLLVEPSARGLGIGARLTGECVQFARARGYQRITLWTHKVLTAARHIYAQAGFKLTSSEARKSFGHDVISEHWDSTL